MSEEEILKKGRRADVVFVDGNYYDIEHIDEQVLYIFDVHKQDYQYRLRELTDKKLAFFKKIK